MRSWVIKAVMNALAAVDISAWLFGGWGPDARIGRITPAHGDVEFWVQRADAERSKAVLVETGATALMTQPPGEGCEFTWTASPSAPHALTGSQTDRSAGHRVDGLTGYPAGLLRRRARDARWHAGAGHERRGHARHEGAVPHLRNGQPWRQKGVEDIKILRRLAAEADAQP